MLEGKLFSVKLNSAFDEAAESCKYAENGYFVTSCAVNS